VKDGAAAGDHERAERGAGVGALVGNGHGRQTLAVADDGGLAGS
jgi:hypothetical protein